MKITEWDSLPLLLSVKETSQLIGYGQARVRELCNAKLLPCIRLGRAFRIPKEPLRVWLSNQVNTTKTNCKEA